MRVTDHQKRALTGVFVPVALVILTSAAVAQPKLTVSPDSNGVVRDAVSDWVIPGAHITLRGRRNAVVSDSQGRFSLGKVYAESLVLIVTAKGYRDAIGDFSDHSSGGMLQVELFSDTADSTQPLSILRSRWVVNSPYFALGCKSADEDIARKTVSLPSSGLKSGFGIDDSTGFPIHPIAGCSVTDSIMGFEEGYRARIRRWVQENGIPDWSRKRWLEDLRSASGFFSNCSSGHAPIRVGFSEGLTAVSPNGRWTIFTRPDLEHGPQGRYFWLMLEDSAGSLPNKWLMICDRTAKIDVRWGPPGADIVLIHRFSVWKLGEITCSGDTYVVTDLRTGAALRWEDDLH